MSLGLILVNYMHILPFASSEIKATGTALFLYFLLLKKTQPCEVGEAEGKGIAPRSSSELEQGPEPRTPMFSALTIAYAFLPFLHSFESLCFWFF